MVTTQKASNRTGTQTRLEGILGVPEGHHAPLLSLWFARGAQRGGGAKAFNYCRRCNYAADTGASEARLYILSEHSFRWCVSLPGALSGEWGGNSGGWATVDELNKLGSPSSVRLSCVAIRTSNKKQQLSVIHSRIPFAKSLTGIESFHHNSVENHEVFTRNDTLFMATRSNSTFQKWQNRFYENFRHFVKI